jgi:hypothetical protein
MLLELVSEFIKILGMACSALIIRWMMEISTPRHDWMLVKQTFEYAYDSVRIPDWREWFNMDRLSRLREHPDVRPIVVESFIIPIVTPSDLPHNANNEHTDCE